jgi:hypothetical protein
MGEIKSTMDLVMERTRHLSMSPEEKARQQRSDFEKRLQGFLQQHADGALTRAELHRRIADLQETLQVDDPALLTAGICKRIDPVRENQLWLELVTEVDATLTAPLREILDAHRRTAADLSTRTTDQMRQQLAQEHGVRGSAVMPNPQRDGRYRAELDALQQQTRRRIDDIAGRMA